jgi:hypothetical protein
VRADLNVSDADRGPEPPRSLPAVLALLETLDADFRLIPWLAANRGGAAPSVDRFAG